MATVTGLVVRIVRGSVIIVLFFLWKESREDSKTIETMITTSVWYLVDLRDLTDR